MLYIFITAGGWGSSLHSKPFPSAVSGSDCAEEMDKRSGGSGFNYPIVCRDE